MHSGQAWWTVPEGGADGALQTTPREALGVGGGGGLRRLPGGPGGLSITNHTIPTRPPCPARHHVTPISQI